jgi:endonuclease/exonuclease/phosphatase family metal-dependent hydrolase
MKSNNSKIFVFNTHLDHMSALARENGKFSYLKLLLTFFLCTFVGLELLFSKIQVIAFGFPALLIGDFNVDESDPLIQRITNPKGMHIFLLLLS